MQTRLMLVVVFLAGATMAGCVGHGSPNASTASPGAIADAGRGLGRITGTVLDLEQRPIDGVTIRIISKSDAAAPVVTLRTNATGGFDAQGLSEGAYTLYVTKEDYKDLLPLAVTVSSGATSNVVVTMQEQKAPLAYHTSFSRSVTFDAHACVIVQGDPQCQTAFDPGNVTIVLPHNEETDGPLADIIVEATWTPDLPICGNGVQTHVYSPDQKGLDLTFADGNSGTWVASNPYHWDNVPERTKNPTYLDVPRDANQTLGMLSPERTKLNNGKPINLTGEWKIQTWPYSKVGALGTPVDVDCMTEQKVTIWTTAFYLAPAPTGWSIFKQG